MAQQMNKPQSSQSQQNPNRNSQTQVDKNQSSTGRSSQADSSKQTGNVDSDIETDQDLGHSSRRQSTK